MSFERGIPPELVICEKIVDFFLVNFPLAVIAVCWIIYGVFMLTPGTPDIMVNANMGWATFGTLFIWRIINNDDKKFFVSHWIITNIFALTFFVLLAFCTK